MWPIEQIAAENPEELQRSVDGQLPSGVGEAAVRARITAAVDDRWPAAITTTPWRCSATAG